MEHNKYNDYNANYNITSPHYKPKGLADCDTPVRQIQPFTTTEKKVWGIIGVVLFVILGIIGVFISFNKAYGLFSVAFFGGFIPYIFVVRPMIYYFQRQKLTKAKQMDRPL
jgi:hypothetical protein